MSYYIVQNMHKYLNIEHFQKDENEALRFIDETITKPTFDELFNLKYSMVVAEPGYGKTRLLKEIVLKAHEQKRKAFFLDSKSIKKNIVESIHKPKKVSSNISEEDLQKEYLFSNSLDFTLEENVIICLDALDELAFSKLYDFFEMIENFMKEYSNVQLFVSCRTHHLQKVDFDLSKLRFEYITLEAFYENQIREYLSTKHSPEIIKEIVNKSDNTELFTFISIPRYLYYFSALIESKRVKEITKLSRAEMFEDFIYRKLDKERDKGIPKSQYDVIKRVLEKISIVMKIYQVSQISKDELFTIFEDIDSNFSQIIFRDDLLNSLYDKSIIKDNIDFIEFENQEFLDFLAAKEVNRFDKVEQTFFDIAVEPHLQEIYTSWFYVLPFLLEQKPSMIRILLDFLNKNSDKTLREQYFYALTSIETKLIDEKLKQQIFSFVFDYHTKHNKWLRINSLVNFYDEDEHYQALLDSIDESKSSDEDLYVRRNNAVDLIELLIKSKKLSPDKINFWKEKYFQWLRLDVIKNQVLHRNIINSLPIVSEHDFDYIKSLYFIFETGIETQYNFARACYKIMPEDPFSISIYYKAYRFFQEYKQTRAISSSDGISYILKLKTYKGISYALTALIVDYGTKDCQLGFLFRNLYTNYEDKLNSFAKHISSEFKIENIQVIKKFISILGNRHSQGHDKERYLKNILISDIISKDENYIFELIELEYKRYKNKEAYFWDIENLIYHDLITYINDENFDTLHELLQRFENERCTTNSLMYRLFISDLISSKIKEKIESIYNDYIIETEKNLSKQGTKNERDSKNRFLGLCRQWEHKIEPEKDKFMTDLFRFYTSQKSTLIDCERFEENRLKTIEQAKDVIKNYNPLNAKVEVNGNSTTTWGLHYFNDCIELLYNEKTTLDEQVLVDNVFRYLPFNINSDYETTLKLAINPSPEAIQDIIDVYSGQREDDLDISNPQNFIQIYKKLHLKEAEELLLLMLFNQNIEKYIKEQIIDTLPKTVLTETKIKQYLKEFGYEDELYEEMLSTLIVVHNNKKALNRAFLRTIRKAREANIPNSEFSLDGTSLDFFYNKLVFALINSDYSFYRINKLLLISEQLGKKGKRHNARFLQDIVFEHIKYLKHKESFEPIFKIEKFLQENRDKTTLHWFEYKLLELKEIYLEELAKPNNISASIKQYNELKEKDYMSISSSSHLLEIVQNTISKDLTNWIENEGAYKYIEELAKKDKNTNAEDFIQKTIISQIELSLFKKGFRSTDFRIKREEQTLDDKRIDITISYGFIGSILIELKLAHNPEAKPTQAKGKEYVSKLKTYIDGTHSDYGIFLIFNIKSEQKTFNKQMQELTKLYKNEKDIVIMGINCKV